MNKTKRNARGITLIALVITIIVLLILAGVTISALSGDNGILKRATEAKAKTGKENAEEQIKLAIMTATTEGLGVPDKAVLRSELTKAGFVVKTDGDDLPWEVVSGKNIFTINEDYTIDTISGIGLSKKEVKLLKGQTETITATLTEGVSGTITWESSNTNVATVANGTITATGTSGEATITAKVEGTEYEAECQVIIIQKVTAITASDVTVGKNETAKIQVTTTPSGEVEDLTYTSGTPSVATVSEDGTVKGLSEGTSVITIKGKVSTSVSTTCTVTVTKTKVRLTADQIAANKETYYGAVAQNYTKGGLTYRIFYVDKEGNFGDGANTIYLKADYKEKKSLSTDISKLTDADITKYKKMNPLWAAERGNAKSEWEENEKAAAWLCAPSVWKDYADSNISGSYAIGGPSAEMYVASYNDVAHNNGTAKGGLSTEYSTKNAPGYIYKVNGELYNSGWSTAEDSLDYKGYNSMYVEKNGSYWWLASPSSNNSNRVCYVDGYYARLDYDFFVSSCGGSNGVGPLVSLPSTFTVEVE